MIIICVYFFKRPWKVILIQAPAQLAQLLLEYPDIHPDECHRLPGNHFIVRQPPTIVMVAWPAWIGSHLRAVFLATANILP